MTDLVGLGSLVRLVLRRDRVRLPVWILAILGVVYASAAALQGVYGTPARIETYQRTIGSSPAQIAINGPPTALDSIAGITVFEISATAIVAVALMAIFLVVRHTRGEEEAGRTELLRAGVLGRYAPIAAPVLVVSAASLVVGFGIALMLAAIGLPTGGSVVYGTSIAAIGVLFTAVGAVGAQVTTHARGAIAFGGVVLGASFVLRAVGDVAENGASWFSPIGWSQAVRPFADDRWWPLAISLAATCGLILVVRALAGRRDLGAGLVADRPGSPTAAPWLAGPAALAARLQRGSVLGWTVGLALVGLAFGSFGGEVRDLVDSNPVLADFLGGSGADLVDLYLNTVLLILALMASGFAIASALRMWSEEDAGRAEVLLGTALSRARWAAASLAVTLAATVIALTAGGLGVGIARATDAGDAGEIGRLVVAALAYLPAVLVTASVAVLLWGWFPRFTMAAWAMLAMCFVIEMLGGLLELPTWILNLSPLGHVQRVPAATVAASPLLVLTGVAAVATGLGVAGFRRRDLDV